MQIASATKTRLPHDSVADLACGSTRWPLGVNTLWPAGWAGWVGWVVGGGTGRADVEASRCTGWPIGRERSTEVPALLLLTGGVP